MRYFVFSDIHGCINELKIALQAKGYDENNTNHRLLFLGDAFDKNKDDAGMLVFLLSSIKNDKLIWVKGNHDIYLLNALKNKKGNIFSLSTIKNLARYYDKSVNVDDITKCLDVLLDNKLDEFIVNNTLDYFELDKYVFTHGFIPFDRANKMYDPSWREKLFSSFINENGIKRVLKDKIKIPGKTLVAGHVCSFYGNILRFHPEVDYDSKEFISIKNEIERNIEDNIQYYQTFISDDVIGLDGRCYKTGLVNILVIDD